MISGLMMIKRKVFTCEPEPSTLLDWLCAFALFIVLLFCNLFVCYAFFHIIFSPTDKNIYSNNNETSSNSCSLYLVKYPPTSFTFFLSCFPTPLHSPHRNVSFDWDEEKKKAYIFFTVSHPFSLLFIYKIKRVSNTQVLSCHTIIIIYLCTSPILWTKKFRKYFRETKPWNTTLLLMRIASASPTKKLSVTKLKWRKWEHILYSFLSLLNSIIIYFLSFFPTHSSVAYYTALHYSQQANSVEEGRREFSTWTKSATIIIAFYSFTEKQQTKKPRIQ